MKWLVLIRWSALLLSVVGNEAFSEPPPVVAITAHLDGQGVLMTRLNRCFAVLPAHVMGNDLHASLVGTDAHDPDGDGLLIGLDRGRDLAVLEVSGGLTRHCGSDFVAAAPDNSLHARGAAILTFVPPGGAAVSHLPLVTLDVGPDEIAVEAINSKRLGESFSGSLVTVDEQPAAMLMWVEAKTGVGHARRYEQLAPFMRSFADAVSPPLPSRSPGTSASFSQLQGASNFASEAYGARVVRWSAPPYRPDTSATNLIGSNAALRWIAPLRGGVIDADIELAGAHVRSITHVQVDLSQVPATQRASRCEVLVSTDGESWALVATTAISVNAESIAEDFPPRLARFVRLRLRNAGEPSTPAEPMPVSLGPVYIR